MMGRLGRDQEQFFHEYRLDVLVPADHLVRKVDAVLDPSWLRAERRPRRNPAHHHRSEPAQAGQICCEAAADPKSRLMSCENHQPQTERHRSRIGISRKREEETSVPSGSGHRNGQRQRVCNGIGGRPSVARPLGPGVAESRNLTCMACSPQWWLGVPPWRFRSSRLPGSGGIRDSTRASFRLHRRAQSG